MAGTRPERNITGTWCLNGRHGRVVRSGSREKLRSEGSSARERENDAERDDDGQHAARIDE